MHKVKYIGGSLIILLAFWQIVTWLGGWNEALFPSPLGTVRGLGELLASGVLAADIRASLSRFALGYISAVVLAMALGLVLGWYKKIWNYLNPVAQVLRPVSPVAWLPFIVLFFGIGEMPALVIIFIAAFFPVLLATVAAVQGMEPVYLKVAQNFGIGQPQILGKIVFPAVFPRIATGLHLALGTAWVFLVAGEMAGAQSGLGFLIIDARNNLRADWLMAAILTIGVLGLVLDGIVSYLEGQIYRRWGLTRRT
ncbi:MAG: ABC transporter permease [Selenomonas sp.]|nr:ABC transporter permease [Selenomonas sp.]